MAKTFGARKSKTETRGRPKAGEEPRAPKGPYVPTGRPRGRPKMDPSQLKPKKVYVPKGRKVGGKVENRGAHLRVDWVPVEPKGPYVPTGKPRGRKKKEESD